MKSIKKFAVGIAIAASFIGSASADVIQTSVGSGSYDGYQAWGTYDIGDVAFAKGTNSVLGLTSTASLWDQGWGGQCPSCNQVFVGLYQDGKRIWAQHVAGAYHVYSTQTYDIANDPNALSSLNAAMAAVNWNATQSLTMQLEAAPIGWGGWELHVRNASFTVDSAAVPEPASLTLLGMGFAGLFAARRKPKA